MLIKMHKLYKKYEEIINYLVVGVLTTLVSLISYYVLTLLVLNPNKPIELQISNVISWILSVSFAFLANKKYVFKLENKTNLKEVIKFYLSRVTTLLIDMLLMYIFVTKLSFNDKIVKIFIQIIIIILNYVFSKFLVFKKVENDKKGL